MLKFWGDVEFSRKISVPSEKLVVGDFLVFASKINMFEF